MDNLVFLKLGGSLITDKTKAYTPRLDKLRSLAREIREALRERPETRLVLGHGSGSFGHYAVHEHLGGKHSPPTRAGRSRSDLEYWKGFAEVWYRASQLNRHVIEALREAGVPTVSWAASSAATTSGGEIRAWEESVLRAALGSGVIPLIFGDIVFDDQLGGKVLSTEALMWRLAQTLRPQSILLAGLEAAVWSDFPGRTAPIAKITRSTFEAVTERIGASHGPDVTGGMRSKVAEMLDLVQAVPGLTVRIFSGEEGGNVRRALAGAAIGTLVAGD